MFEIDKEITKPVNPEKIKKNCLIGPISNAKSYRVDCLFATNPMSFTKKLTRVIDNGFTIVL